VEREADVVVVGGGIIGCASAYYAAKRGARVLLVDKGDLGFEQSTRNWGWVHQQVRYPHLVPLAVMSTELWMGLEKELAADLEWVQGGNLSLAFNARDLEAFEGYRDRAREAGLHSEILGRDPVEELVPGMRGPWIGALHIPSDGQANPDLATAAFARAAQQQGAELQPRCAAEGVELRNGAVCAVVTERGTVRTGQVVVAAGAWSRRFLRPLGVRIPQSAVRATVVRTTATERVTRVTAWGRGVAFRQDRRGRFVLAGGGIAAYDVTFDALRDLREFAGLAWKNRRYVRLRVGRPLLRDLATLIPGAPEREHPWAHLRSVEPPPDRGAIQHNLTRFRELFPALGGLEVEQIWAGNIDAIPDEAPVIGPVGTPRGLIVATGFSGHGFALGPGAGMLVSELLAGAAPSVDLHPYRYARFAEGDLAPLVPFRPA
jgi:glycine/D-amino acid oxidase-like deaminating enzyme